MTGCVINHGTDKAGEERRAEATHGLLCKNHARRLSEWLRDIAVDYSLLDTILQPGSSNHERRSSGHESAPPVNLSVVALRDSERGGTPRDRGEELWYELPDVPSVLGTIHNRAEDIRAELDPSHEPDPSIKDRYLTTEVTLLLHAYSTVCEAAWVDELFEEVKRLWIALQRVHGRERPRPLGHCLEVDCDGMVWPRPDASPWCSKCKRIYESAADLGRLAVEEDNRRNAAKKRQPA